jgi:hypothetical protein
MINNKDRLLTYLNSVINSVFKVLPLYEEENVGLETYIESLLFELYGLDKVVSLEQSAEYISLLSTLESIKYEIAKSDSKKSTVKREIFKCINVIKNMVAKLKEGEQS